MSVTTVVLADDHHLVRHSLRVMLETKPEFRVVGEAEDGLQALELLDRLKPDVIVIDVMMPRLGGLEVARQARKRSPSTRVVVLSMYADEAYVTEALRSGAQAYVLKSASPEEFVTAIKEAAAGHPYLSPPLSELAIRAYISAARASSLETPEPLTPREREVLHLAAQGYTTSQIARMLSISQQTAQTHRRNMMHRLKLHSQTDVVRYAIEKGILKPRG
ncbi:MAG: response regulator transcription factor [Dehalococcoidia bacterium]|nr:response regulator transcription factor [Dehalococcoidia bacterium]